MCVKYEPSTKWTTPEFKGNRFRTSSLQSPLEPDLKNTDQLIKTSVATLLGWNFHDWLGTIKSPSCESLKMIWYAKWILLTKTWKIVLVCKIHKWQKKMEICWKWFVLVWSFQICIGFVSTILCEQDDNWLPTYRLEVNWLKNFREKIYIFIREIFHSIW